MAMEKHWLGGTASDEGTFDLATNWSDGIIPAVGDTLIFDGRAGIASGAVANHTDGLRWNCNVGLDDILVNFAEIIIDADFTGSIGLGDDASLDTNALQVSWDKLTVRGSGTYYFSLDDGANGDLTIVDTASGSVFIGIFNSATAKALTEVINVRSAVELQDYLVSFRGQINVETVRSLTADAVTTIPHGNVGTLDLYLGDGTVYCNSNITNLYKYGGTLQNGQSTYDPTIGLAGKTYTNASKSLAGSNGNYVGVEAGDEVYLLDQASQSAFADGWYEVASVDADNGASLVFTVACGADATVTVGGVRKRSGSWENYLGTIDWRNPGYLKGLKNWGGTVNAKGGGIKILGDPAVNSGTIEVSGGLLDLASYQSGGITLGTNCEVAIRGTQANFYPPKEVDITW